MCPRNTLQWLLLYKYRQRLQVLQSHSGERLASELRNDGFARELLLYLSRQLSGFWNIIFTSIIPQVKDLLSHSIKLFTNTAVQYYTSILQRFLFLSKRYSSNNLPRHSYIKYLDYIYGTLSGQNCKIFPDKLLLQSLKFNPTCNQYQSKHDLCLCAGKQSNKINTTNPQPQSQVS